MNQTNELIGSINHYINEIKSIISINSRELNWIFNEKYKDPKRLLRHELQINSQNGEDGVINEIFLRIGTKNKVFAEIGIGDGLENNTAFLLSQDWRGYWIDANDEFTKNSQIKNFIDRGMLKTEILFVNRENIKNSFEKLDIPKDLDLLCIDVDQNTYYIWEALIDYKPRVIVIEYNSAIPPNINWKVNYDPLKSWDGTQNFGASLKAIEQLGALTGYCLVACDFNGVNAFLVREDLVAEKFSKPFTAENHYEPPRYQFIHRRGHKRSIFDTPKN